MACSVLGSAITIIGLYMVLWGKSKEMKKVTDQLVASKSSQECVEVENPINSSSETNTDIHANV